MQAVAEGFKVAVLLPCHNQAATIGAVVRGFADALPAARIYVFDNNSTDDTARVAARAGARVLSRGAARARATSCGACSPTSTPTSTCIADGDGAYDPADAPSLVNALITERVDMVVGTRATARHGRRAAPRRSASALRLALPPLLRRRRHRHLLGLPRLHAPLREELSGHLDRLRHRDRSSACMRAS